MNNYSTCQLCTLCEIRTTVIPYGGDSPCDILFIRETPGQSEDTLGTPCCGPEQRALDALLDKAEAETDPHTASYGFTSLVACVTPGLRPPTKVEIAACYPRLQHVITAARPRFIIGLSKLVHSTLTKAGWDVIPLTDPARISIYPEDQIELEEKRFYLNVANLIRQVNE